MTLRAAALVLTRAEYSAKSNKGFAWKASASHRHLHLKRARYYWERGRPRPHSVLGTIFGRNRKYCSRFALIAGAGARVRSLCGPYPQEDSLFGQSYGQECLSFHYFWLSTIVTLLTAVPRSQASCL